MIYDQYIFCIHAALHALLPVEIPLLQGPTALLYKIRTYDDYE